MRVEITYWEAGRTWKEVVNASNVEAAKKVAKARNPTIRIVGLNPLVG